MIKELGEKTITQSFRGKTTLVIEMFNPPMAMPVEGANGRGVIDMDTEEFVVREITEKIGLSFEVLDQNGALMRDAVVSQIPESFAPIIEQFKAEMDVAIAAAAPHLKSTGCPKKYTNEVPKPPPGIQFNGVVATDDALQSDGFVAGASGWQLKGADDVELWLGSDVYIKTGAGINMLRTNAADINWRDSLPSGNGSAGTGQRRYLVPAIGAPGATLERNTLGRTRHVRCGLATRP